MATYKITAPDGKSYKITAPEGTSQEDALNHFKSQWQPTADEQPKKQGSYVKNALLGFAARGNEALSALTPFIDEHRVAREKEWVKQNEGAGLGQTLADMAITAPIGGMASMPARIVGSGLAEAITHPKDKLSELAYGMAGAGAGEALGKGLGYLAHPFRNQASRARSYLAQKANEMGINLNAAQETGNKSLQYLNSALDYLPSSSSAQEEFKNAQRDAWQKALFEQGGEHGATQAGQAEMGAMKQRIGSIYNDVASRNNITVDQQLKDALDALAHDRNISRMDANKKGIVTSYLEEFNQPPVGSTISGQGYQNTRSMLDKQAKSMENSNPLEANTLKQIRSHLDEAMQRSVTPEDAAKLMKANNDYAVMKSIQKSINPTTEEISPNLLTNYLTRRDPNRMIYGQGDQTLNDIAKVGKEFIPNKLPDSGTAQRADAMKFLSGAGAGKIAGALYLGNLGFTQDPMGSIAPALGAGVASILMPKVAGKLMRKQGGYLSKGLLDMEAPLLGNLSRQRALSELSRNVGLQSLNSVRNNQQ